MLTPRQIKIGINKLTLFLEYPEHYLNYKVMGVSESLDMRLAVVQAARLELNRLEEMRDAQKYSVS